MNLQWDLGKTYILRNDIAPLGSLGNMSKSSFVIFKFTINWNSIFVSMAKQDILIGEVINAKAK